MRKLTLALAPYYYSSTSSIFLEKSGATADRKGKRRFAVQEKRRQAARTPNCLAFEDWQSFASQPASENVAIWSAGACPRFSSTATTNSSPNWQFSCGYAALSLFLILLLQGCLPYMSVKEEPISLSVISKDTSEDIAGGALLIPVYEREAELYVLEEQDTNPIRCFLEDPVYLTDTRKIVSETAASIGFFPGMAIGNWTDLVGGIVVVPGFRGKFWEFTPDEEYPPVLTLTRLEPDKAVAYQAELREMFQKKRLSKEDLSGFGMWRYREAPVRFSLAGHKMLEQFLVQK